ncbi:MAG TPA: hypothetical protein VI386_24855 [Candidatus Sulfotelmatobacter sp.]
MSLTNIKASLLRYSDMSLSALTQLKAWMKRSASFSNFDVESFAATSLRVASATSATGETLCYCPIETVFMVSAYAVNPNATPTEARTAGDAIDAQVARQAQLAGVSKLLIVVPADNPCLQENEWSDFKEVRVFERKIPNTVNTPVGCSTPSQETQYLN